MKIETTKNELKRVIRDVVQSFTNGNEQIMIQVPKFEDIEFDLIDEIGISLPDINILVATGNKIPKAITSNSSLNFIDFDELFEKKISINGEIKRNEFHLLIIDRIQYGNHDDYTTESERKNPPHLTNRINYLRRLYKIPIISMHKSDEDKPLRMNHFRKKINIHNS